MCPKFILTPVIIFLSISSQLYGQELESITLDDCIAIAFRNQPALRVKREETHLAQETVAIARSNYFPQVVAQASLTGIDEVRSFEIDNLFDGNVGDVFTDAAAFFQLSRQAGTTAALNSLDNPDTPLFPGDPMFPAGHSFNTTKALAAGALPTTTRVDVLGEVFLNTQIQLIQPLWTAGRIKYRVEQSKFGVTIARLAEERVRQSLRYNVTRAYYSVLLSRHLQAIAVEASRQIKSTENRLLDLFEGGDLRVTRSEILRVQSAQRLLQSQIPRLEVAERRAFAALMQAIGVSQSSEMNVARESLTYLEQSFSEEEMLSIAVAHRPEIRQASSVIQVARLEGQVAVAEFFPEVVGFGRMSSIHDDRGFANPNDDIEWAGGIAASLTLSAGGRRLAQKRVATHQIARAKAGLQQIQQLVEREVQDAFLDFEQARKMLSLNHAAYQSAKEAIELMDDSEYAGIITDDEGGTHVRDKIVTSFLFAKAGTDFYQGLFSYNLALAQLSFASGTDITQYHSHASAPQSSMPEPHSFQFTDLAGAGQ